MKSLAWSKALALALVGAVGVGCGSPRSHVDNSNGGSGGGTGNGGSGGGGTDSGADGPINTGALRITPASGDVGTVLIGQSSAPLALTVMNTGTTSSGALGTALSGTDAAQFMLAGDGCKAKTLAAGESCQISVQLTPTAMGTKSATLTVTSPSAGSSTASLTGNALAPGALAIAPLTNDFGSVLVGAQATAVTFTIKNTGQVATGALSTAALGGANAADFKITADMCKGQTLATNATCTVSATFAPATAGQNKAATLTVMATPGGAAVAMLSGTAVAPASLVVTPTPHDYGVVVTGNTAVQVYTVMNPGGQPTSAPTATLSNTTDFMITDNGCTAAIPANGSCMLSVRFAPSAGGNKMATLTLTATTGGTGTAMLSGMGLSPSALKVTPASADFSNVMLNATSVAQTFTVTNTGDMATGSLSVAFSGSDAGQFMIASDTCSGMPLQGNNSTCTVGVVFKPTTRGAKSASLVITGRTTEQAAASLTGKGQGPAVLGVSPGSAAFGTVTTGMNATAMFTITNNGDVASGVPAAAISGTDMTQFAVSTNTCTAALAPMTSCMVTVRFSPTTAGTKSASLTVVASPGGTVMATLGGMGVTPPMLSLVPAMSDSGIVDAGSQGATQTFTVTNNGGSASSALTVSKTGTDAASFVIISDTCTGTMLAGGSGCTITLSFRPSAFGSKSATLTVTATSGGTVSSTLSGTGRDFIQVTVGTAGTGTGTVSSTPAGTCNGGICTYARTTANPSVTFTAAAASTSTFTSWAGLCTGTTNPCTVTLSANGTLTATFTIQTYTLMYGVGTVGTGAGTVSVSPAGTSCGTGCNRYNAGTPVTVTANPTSGYVTAWFGDCAAVGLTRTCNLMMTKNMTATANFTSLVNRVFATSTTYTLTQLANLGTVAGTTQTMTDKVVHGADQACAMAAASNSALAGKYVAWIASPTQSAVQRIGSTARGWVRPDGKPFGDSLTSITAQKVVYYPAAQTEAGTLSTGGVWTGAQTDGTAYPGSNCNNFTSIAATDTGVVGFREAGSELWSTAYSMPCNMTAGVMCFETDFGVIVPAPAPPATKRWMFYTASAFDPSRGLTGADTLCKNEAATNPTLAGATFSALLTTTTASIVSRFTVRNLPIVRPDGVVLWASDANFLTSGSDPISAPSVASDGLTYSGLTSCWTGASAPSDPQTLGNGYTCLDWTTNQPGTNNGGVSGTTGYSSRAWYNQGTPFCNPSGGHIYCLQN